MLCDGLYRAESRQILRWIYFTSVCCFSLHSRLVSATLLPNYAASAQKLGTAQFFRDTEGEYDRPIEIYKACSCLIASSSLHISRSSSNCLSSEFSNHQKSCLLAISTTMNMKLSVLLLASMASVALADCNDLRVSLIPESLLKPKLTSNTLGDLSG